MIYLLYKTTNLINNKTYIGIHQTNKIDDGYLGSGLAMERAIKKYGKHNFKREIIEYCDSYDELLEREKHYVNEKWVSEDTNYNLKTGGQSSGVLSEESKAKISNTLKEKYASGEIKSRNVAPYVATDEQKKQISESLKERYKTKTHHRKGCKGQVPWNKGKKGQIPWNKGLTGLTRKPSKLGPMSEEQKKKQSESLKEYYKTHIHPTKGLDSWNKGLKMEQVTCPHCSKLTDIANGKRWHFDNCKLK